MTRRMLKFLPLVIVIAQLSYGCSHNNADKQAAKTPDTAVQMQEANVYQGSVKGKSMKAKTISIEVGKGEQAKTIMVKFDDSTKGVEHADPGHAAIIHYKMQDGSPLATEVKPKLAKLPEGVTEIKTAELKALYDSNTEFVLIDARPGRRYTEAHIPNSVNLTVQDYDTKAATVLPKNKETLVIFYCGGVTCGLSTDNAGRAKKDGYKNVKVYLEGEPVWFKAGYMLYATHNNVEKDNIVLIDLRSKDKSEAGRIPRSVTIPFTALESRIDDIPMKAPIVLYSETEKEAASGVALLRENGFKKVALVTGSYNGWIKSGRAVETGPIKTDIIWKRELGKGEVAKADFMKAVTGEDSEAVILDVRSKDETASGALKNAILIPLDQIGSRTTELPKGKKVYVHCSTGARADMAVQELKKSGYNAEFLVADVECQGNDCTIED